MIIIRLKRKSSKNNLTYSVVVTSDTYSSKSNQYLEDIGTYKPIIDR